MIYLLAAATAFAVDRVTKAVVDKRIADGERVTVVKGKLSLTKLKNHGAAGGLLAGHGGLLSVMTLGSAIMILRMYHRLIREHSGAAFRLSRALVLGGGAGNVYDRLRGRGVTDFVAFERGPLKRIVFNAADVFIAVGILIFAFKCLVLVLKKPNFS
jgi:signal peptidase II